MGISPQEYPDYKDSGVDWFGKVPKNWKVAGFKKYLDSIVDYRGKTPDKVDEGIFLVTARNIKNGSICYDLSHEYISEEDYAQVMSRGLPVVGDVLFTTEAPLGEVANVDNTNIALAQRIIKFRGKEGILNNYFLKYFILSEMFQGSLMLFASGSTALGIKAERLVYLRQLVPQLEEQLSIVNFLDHETAKIDTLIDKQQQLIKLLKEKRQAVISHAVTKGLNPAAPMKDSGVEWLGEVPEHWGVSALGYYASLSTGATPDRSKPSYWNGDIPWIKTGEVRYDTIFETEEMITNEGLNNSAVQISPPGTLLMAMYGQGVTRGRVALLGVSATYNQACVAITPREKVTNQFLRYFFMAAYHAIRDDGNETSQMNLNADIVRKFKIVVPSQSEQEQIVQMLEVELERYTLLEKSTQKAVDLMKERRSALISAAVTGKIDVRNWQSAQTKIPMEASA